MNNLSTSTLDAARRAYLNGAGNPLKAGRIADGRNLYLSIAPTGAMSWVFIWMSNGRSREYGLGSFTGKGAAVALSLKDARMKADHVRAQLHAGIDPVVERLAARQQAACATVTFEQVLIEKIAALRDDWKGSDNERQWLSSMTTHAAKLLPMSVASIGEDDVLAVLRPIWKSIAVTAERVRYRIEQVLELAKSRKLRTGDNPARYAGHIEVLLGKRPTKKTKARKGEETSHLAMTYAELPAFMGRLLTSTGNGARALAFCILTATRTDEARLMQWSEVDLDAGRWTIPALRMKAGVEHVVPLSTQAIELLRSMARVEGNPFVFTGTKGPSLGETALSDKLTKGSAKGGLGYAGKATVHGFRSTFSDWVGDCTTFAKEDREFCLAHGLDAVEGAYRRSTAVEKRRAIMQAWANFAHGNDNVVALKAVA